MRFMLKGVNLSETFKVAAIIEKLPMESKDFKKLPEAQTKWIEQWRTDY